MADNPHIDTIVFFSICLMTLFAIETLSFKVSIFYIISSLFKLLLAVVFSFFSFRALGRRNHALETTMCEAEGSVVLS